MFVDEHITLKLLDLFVIFLLLFVIFRIKFSEKEKLEKLSGILEKTEMIFSV